MSEYDLCVIGGGINGAGIARDAAGRGLKVILVEAGDLGEATSSRSTKLIHGGLRYLEFYEFGLVREALKEREVLLRMAPHLVQPLEFILPHDAHLRPAWMIRAGLFLYDYLGTRLKKRALPRSHHVDLLNDMKGEPLDDRYSDGFSYADCRTDDARLVALNALDVAERGGVILTRTRCISIKPDRHRDRWEIGLDEGGPIRARMLVNAGGPWVHKLLADNGLAHEKTPGVRLVKGSHIVARKLYEGAQAYILQQPDGRIVFAIPYEKDFTLIGTTEKDYEGDPAEAAIDPDETLYLCECINRAFKKQIAPEDVVWAYSGVRPLVKDEHEDARATTREYRLEIDESHGPLMLSVFGGKITTFRRLSEEAVNRLQKKAGFPGKPWTARVPLPGGGMERGDFRAFLEAQRADYPWLPDDLLRRYARHYGARLRDLIGTADSLEGLGAHYGDGLYEAEARHLIREEFARAPDDILWRRTKLALHITAETKARFEAAFADLKKDILTS